MENSFPGAKMPKVRPLTREMREKQADQEAVKRVSDKLLGEIGAERGRRDMTKEEMADYLGITRASLNNWAKDGLGGTSLRQAVKMARKVGFQFDLVPVG